MYKKLDQIPYKCMKLRTKTKYVWLLFKFQPLISINSLKEWKNSKEFLIPWVNFGAQFFKLNVDQSCIKSIQIFSRNFF